jgi:hypothetical protein
LKKSPAALFRPHSSAAQANVSNEQLHSIRARSNQNFDVARFEYWSQIAPEKAQRGRLQ